MNTIDKAIEILKNGWCKGQSRQDLPEGTAFCSSGAIWEAHGLPWGGMEAVDMTGYDTDATVIAEVIRENYPDLPLTTSLYTPSSVVIGFNDDYAQSVDEIIAMFEKASVRKDEMV